MATKDEATLAIQQFRAEGDKVTHPDVKKAVLIAADELLRLFQIKLTSLENPVALGSLGADLDEADEAIKAADQALKAKDNVAIAQAKSRVQASENKIAGILSRGGRVPESAQQRAKALQTELKSRVKLIEIAENEANAELESLQTSEMVKKALGQDADLSEVKTILSEHGSKVSAESGVFGSYIDVDDVLAKVEDLTERAKTLQEIGEAIEAAVDRRTRMAKAVAKLNLPKGGGLGAIGGNKLSDDQETALRQTGGLVMRMTMHIPEEWLASWTPNFAQRIKDLTKTEDEKKNELQIEKGKLTPFDPNNPDPERAKDLTAFRGFIEPSSTSKLERSDFYFDEFVGRPDTKEFAKSAQEIAKVQDKLIAQAHKIRDLGGTVRDCEAVFAHIPRQWWPAEFLEEMQAWRKVERGMLRERVEEMLAESKGPVGTAKEAGLTFIKTLVAMGGVESDVAGLGQKFGKVTDSVKDNSPAPNLFTNAMTDTGPSTKLDPNNWADDSQIAAQLGNFADFIGSAAERIKEIKDLLSGGDIAEKIKQLKDPQKLADFFEEVLKMGSTVLKGINAIAKLKQLNLPPQGVWIARILPGMSIACCCVDLFSAIKKLGEHIAIRVKTGKLKEDAQIFLIEGKDQDAGAFVRTIANEIDARHRQIAKDSLEVTTKSLELTGSIGEASGIGAVGGLAIKITGKAIDYGGRVIFTGIEWGIAGRARTLIKEAQAGNPVARVQIFENSALYAKMYIALLVQDGHPLAQKFIIHRGIEEGDLSGPMGIKILREAMMESADQKDERTFDAGEELFGAFAKIPGKIKEGAEKVAEMYRNRGPRDKTGYDPSKALPTPDITSAKWEQVKKEAMVNHLHNEPTGIGDALKAVETAKANIAKAKTPEEIKAANVPYYDALGALYGKLLHTTPYTRPYGEKDEVVMHKPMSTYLALLSGLVMAEMTKADQDSGLTDSRSNFSAPTASLSSTQWTQTYQKGVNEAHLPEDDGGVGKALGALEKALANKSLTDDQNKQAQRKARLGVLEAYNVAITALKECWVTCGDCDAMRDHLTEIMNLAAQDRRTMDETLYKVDPNVFKWPESERLFTAAKWNAMWSKAVQTGVVLESGGDGGMGKALEGWAKQDGVYQTANPPGNTPPKDPKAALAARRALKLSLAKVFESATKLLSLSYLNEDVKQYAIKIRVEATTKTTGIAEQLKTITLTLTTPTYTGAHWEAAIKSAKTAGLCADDASVKKFAKALDTASGARTEFTNLTTFNRDKRVAAQKLMAALGPAQQALSSADAVFHDVHPSLDNYLDELSKEITKWKNDPDIQKSIDGSGITLALTKPDLTKTNWDTAFTAAKNSGAVDDDASAKTLGKSLEDAAKAVATFDKAKAGQKKREAGQALVAAWNVVSQSIAAASNALGKSHASLASYFTECEEEVVVRRNDNALLEAIEGTTAAVTLPSFLWKNDAWQATKKIIIDKGLFDDKSSGFGGSLTDSDKAYKEWDKDKTAVKKKDAARSTTTTVKQSALGYKAATRNPNLQAYWDECITEADKRLNEIAKV